MNNSIILLILQCTIFNTCLNSITYYLNHYYLDYYLNFPLWSVNINDIDNNNKVFLI